MTFKRISAEDAQQLIAQPDTQLVDIRDPRSFASAHIPGALNLSNSNLVDFIAAADLDAPLVVVCYHGISSQPAAEYLVQQGFDDVYSMDGGFESWSKQFPIVAGES